MCIFTNVEQITGKADKPTLTMHSHHSTALVSFTGGRWITRPPLAGDGRPHENLTLATCLWFVMRICLQGDES